MGQSHQVQYDRGTPRRGEAAAYRPTSLSGWPTSWNGRSKPTSEGDNLYRFADRRGSPATPPSCVHQFAQTAGHDLRRRLASRLSARPSRGPGDRYLFAAWRSIQPVQARPDDPSYLRPVSLRESWPDDLRRLGRLGEALGTLVQARQMEYRQPHTNTADAEVRTDLVSRLDCAQIHDLSFAGL
jgi:hypothetical protein